MLFFLKTLWKVQWASYYDTFVNETKAGLFQRIYIKDVPVILFSKFTFKKAQNRGIFLSDIAMESFPNYLRAVVNQ